ncbi:uroporphyrinogen-III synthase [Brucella sp. BE17]|uniref:uroporphyrinogen-III synthase n=1 Tax=Brucella sp. BE17 TaxID=3142977 RepID=UPI0031B9E5FC
MRGGDREEVARQVLVTRPEPAASQTAVRLTRAGFTPLSLPLTRTVALPFSLPEMRFDALTVTSANAFRHIEPHVLQACLDLPLFAVGEGTADAARRAGFLQVSEGGGDAVRLAETIRKALPQGARLLYFAGHMRQPIFEERIKEAGLEMVVRDVYDIEMIDYTVPEIMQVLGDAVFDAVLLYSGVAAERFVDMMHKIEHPFDGQTRFLCISGRVAEKLPAKWQQRALVADHPDENGLFRLLAKV